MRKDISKMILTFLCLILSINSRKLSEEDKYQILKLTPDNVKLVGRYYQNEEEDMIWLVQSGSAVEFYATAFSLDVILYGDNHKKADEDMRPRYAVYLDDNEIFQNTVNDDEFLITVFESEKERRHKVKVMLLSENIYGGVGLRKIVVKSSVKEIIKPVEEKKLLIEFIGDSITCGYGVEGKDKNELFKTTTENFSKSYAYLTAQALDADYSTVAYSGHGVISGYSGGEKNTEDLVINYYELIGRNENYPGKWNFEKNQPDIIVINLGTHDNNYITIGSKRRKEDFVQGYGNFLQTIRYKNPKAIILCTLGTMGAEQVFPLMEKAVKSFGDEKTYVLKLPIQHMNDGYGSDWHPSVKTQQKASEILAEKLSEILDKENELGSKIVLPTPDNVKITGRYYQNNNVTWLIQSGSAIEFYVNGEYASVEIFGDNSINEEEAHRPRFAILLDDKVIYDEILSRERNRYLLFDVNEDKIFKIKIILLSENKYGGVGVRSIHVLTKVKKDAIIPGGGKKRLIEFIGDSITCGFGVEGDKDEDFKTQTENFMKTYAYLTAQNLEADYSTVCYSAYGVVSGRTRVGEKNTQDLVPKYYTLYGQNKNYQGDWDFMRHQPHFIVINLGTNDDTYIRHDPETRNEEFVTEYSKFLKTVRQNNPKAYIICTVGTMWASDLYPLIQKAIKSFGDTRITSYLSETQLEEDGIGSLNHPSAITHQKSANLLTEKINEILNKELPTLKTRPVLLSEQNVKITGRYYKKNDEIWLVQSGSAVEFYLAGKYGDIILLGDSSIYYDENGRPRYGVYVDDELIETDLISDDEHTVILFDIDEIRSKKIKVMLLSENTNGGIGVKTLNIISTVENAVAPVEKKELLIEFIGDSITCGYGVEGKDQNEHFKTSTENFSKSYAYLTAQALDADYTTVAYSGHGIISGYSTGEKNGDALVPDYYTKISKHENYPGEWDFASHQPDIIVINLGTNDNNYVSKIPEVRGNEFIQEYISFLNLVRRNNPKAYIICTVGIMGATELYPSIETAISLIGDDKISSYQGKTQDMADGLGSDWHPSPITHKKASEDLIEKINEILEKNKSN